MKPIDTSPRSIEFYDNLRDNFDTARHLINVVAEYCAATPDDLIGSIRPGSFDQNSLHLTLEHALSLLRTTSDQISVLWKERAGEDGLALSDSRRELLDLYNKAPPEIQKRAVDLMLKLLSEDE